MHLPFKWARPAEGRTEKPAKSIRGAVGQWTALQIALIAGMLLPYTYRCKSRLPMAVLAEPIGGPTTVSLPPYVGLMRPTSRNDVGYKVASKASLLQSSRASCCSHSFRPRHLHLQICLEHSSPIRPKRRVKQPMPRVEPAALAIAVIIVIVSMSDFECV